MASLQQRHWSGEVAGPSRRDRRPCAYEVYLPDLLQGRRFSLDGDVAAEVTRTETALARLDATGNALANSEALARLLLRAESVASSRIEGLEIGGRRLLRADAAQRLGMEPCDVTSREVLGNIDAMTWAVDSVRPGGDITLESLLETHRRLLAGTRLKDHGGSVRTVQNWIGGSDYNPCSASFVPPPPEDVPELLDDLMGFSTTTRFPHWHRLRSHTHSSRPSTHSWTATGAPDVRWSTWCCAGVGWDCGYCRRSLSSWRHGHRSTSAD